MPNGLGDRQYIASVNEQIGPEIVEYTQCPGLGPIGNQLAWAAPIAVGVVVLCGLSAIMPVDTSAVGSLTGKRERSEISGG